ncbi:MAG: hypothetical protein OIF57_17495 [Marinobacterium sp.]|nr:hypothetical protein [Marinobacterium sp.]
MADSILPLEIPACCVQATPPALSFRAATLHPTHRLPFIGDADDRPGCSFWAVPNTGGHLGGLQTGRALGRIYLNHLAIHGYAGGCLSDAVLALTRMSHNPVDDARHGQAVGFLNVLDELLARLPFGEPVHGDDQVLLQQANNGIACDPQAYSAWLSQRLTGAVSC